MTYAIPTQRIAVDLFFDGCEPRRGELFAPNDGGGERAVSELLEGEPRFLPFLDTTERAISLINRDDLVRVVLLLAAVSGEAPLPFERRQHVRLELRNGTHLDGEVYFSPPAARARLSDHLNESDRFVQLHQGNRVHFVQKNYLVRVIETAAPAHAAVRR